MSDKNSGSALHGEGVYGVLLSEIRAGVLPPGARLRETEIAERLGVSRTPVREALRLLEADRIVEHRPRSGAHVCRLDYAEIMELYAMRAALEATAARFAARATSDVEIAALRALNADFAAARGDALRAYEINRRFHGALHDAAKNRFLMRALNGLEKTLMVLGPTTLLDPERVDEAAREHEAVLDALTAQDGPGADALMRAHIEAAQGARLRSMHGVGEASR